MTEIQTANLEPIPNRFFRLRWRFEYSDGKKERIGVWDGASDLPQDSAWAVDKTNLAYAIIEAECKKTFQVMRAVSVEGHRYASMQWEAYSRMPGFGMLGMHGQVRLRPNVSGLSILTDTKKVTVWVNGKTEISELSEHDKLFQIKEHSV